MKKKLLLASLAFGLLFASCGEESPTPTPTPEIPAGTLPVVFHVLYETASSTQQSPPASVFATRMGQLNAFYAGTLYPTAGSAAIDVDFILATQSPDGSAMAEPGIHRVQYTNSTNMSAETFLKSKHPTGSANADIFWDPNRYINIWIFGFDQTTEASVTGISYVAYTTSSNPVAGLPVGDYFLTRTPDYMHGTALNNRYFSQAEGMPTMVHEVGHYLGLFHAFGEKDEDSDPDPCAADPSDYSDDYCSDTYKYSRPAYQPVVGGQVNYSRTNCGGTQVNFRSVNVMDYYFGDRNSFTLQQKARVESVMANSPLIPRSASATKALLESFTGEMTDEIPTPIIME